MHLYIHLVWQGEYKVKGRWKGLKELLKRNNLFMIDSCPTTIITIITDPAPSTGHCSSALAWPDLVPRMTGSRSSSGKVRRVRGE